MSILKKVQQQAGDRPYILVMGRSTSGKSTLGGTLPGKTLFLETRGKEFGGGNAAVKANKLGNHVDVVALGTIEEFLAAAAELKLDKEYDNIMVDSYSGLTFLAGDSPDIAAVLEGKKGNVFAAYDKIRNDIAKVHKAFADLTYAATSAKPKVVVFTLSFDLKLDASGVAADIAVVLKGKASWQEFTRGAPTIVTLAAQNTEVGPKRVMLTAPTGIFLGRINQLMDEDNPKIMEPDLSALLKLMETK